MQILWQCRTEWINVKKINIQQDVGHNYVEKDGDTSEVWLNINCLNLLRESEEWRWKPKNQLRDDLQLSRGAKMAERKKEEKAKKEPKMILNKGGT